jgi:hypothetical protein
MLPPVSEPRAMSQKPAETLAQLPDELPPLTYPNAFGLFVAPKADVSPLHPHANSSIFAIPIIKPSSSFIFSTTEAL